MAADSAALSSNSDCQAVGWPSERAEAAAKLMLKCCFTSTETVGLLGTGAQDVHLDFHTAPEL